MTQNVVNVSGIGAAAGDKASSDVAMTSAYASRKPEHDATADIDYTPSAKHRKVARVAAVRRGRVADSDYTTPRAPTPGSGSRVASADVSAVTATRSSSRKRKPVCRDY